MSVRTLQNFIDGEYRDAAAGETSPLINPATEEEFARAPLSTQEDIDAACNAAARAFESWGNTTPSERSLALIRVADAIEERAEEFVRLESENTGKPIQLTLDEEIPPMVDQIRFFAGACRVLEGKSTGEYMSGYTSMIRREPVGVCAQVTPWNYPMMMAVWKWAPAIAAGNTVVLKPSDTTTVTTVKMAEVMAEFLPPGVFNIVCGDRESASQAIADAGYFNAGQDCTASTRVLAAPGVYKDFVGAITEQAKAAKTGDPDDEDVLYGPLNNPNQLARVQGFLNGAPDHVEVQTGGHQIDRGGYFFEPTVVTGVEQSDDMIQNEIFGPVI